MSRLRSVVIAIFWNAPQRRLRTFWRLLGAVFLIALLSVIVGVLLLGLAQGPNPLLGQLQSNILTIAGIWLATKLLDRRKFADTGIYFDRNWWADLVFGMVLGAILMAGIFYAENAAGWIRITGFFRTAGDSPGFWQAILIPMFFFILVSISEELLFRGFLLLNLAEGFRFRYLGPRGATIAALIITSALFGILHAANPNATFVSSANISLAGLWLGLAYVLTGSLAIPLGIHFTWNFFQGNVFGFPVSGTRFFETTVIAIEQAGPESWTGGAFGPEAGFIGLLAMSLGVVAVLAWLRIRYGRLSVFTTMALPPGEKTASADQRVEAEPVNL